jgi:NAD(P)-dependent dehydrogenase (short-subunit alcohol dehydrogenase family)
MSFELEPHGIGIKTVLPGGMKTDFFGSMVTEHHPAYPDSDRVLEQFRDPNNVATYSTPEEIADVIFEADGKDQLIYVVGEDAKE